MITAEKWHRHPLVVATFVAVVSYLLPRTLDALLGARIQAWVFFAVSLAVFGVVVVVSYAAGRRRSKRLGVMAIGGETPVLFEQEIWEPHGEYLWNVRVGYYDLDEKVVARTLGPYCLQCQTELIFRTKKGVLGTKLGKEDRWECPECRREGVVTKDPEELRDEIKKIIQGRISRGVI